MTAGRTGKPQRLVTVTLRLADDEAAALANAVYMVTSGRAENAAQRAVQAVQVAVREARVRGMCGY